MLLEVERLTSHYGRIEALHAIDLAVAAGELVALVGGNGAGKTTLLRCLSGVQPVTGGTIRYDGADISRMPPDRRVRAGIAQVPERRLVFAPMSVHDNLLMAATRAPAARWRRTWSACTPCSRSSTSAAARPPARSPADSSRCWPCPAR